MFFHIGLLGQGKQKQKETIGSIKLKSFCAAEETNKMTSNLLNGRRYLQMIYPMRGSYLKYIIDTTQQKAPNNRLKKMGREPEYISFQRVPMAKKHEKCGPHH